MFSGSPVQCCPAAAVCLSSVLSTHGTRRAVPTVSRGSTLHTNCSGWSKHCLSTIVDYFKSYESTSTNTPRTTYLPGSHGTDMRNGYTSKAYWTMASHSSTPKGWYCCILGYCSCRPEKISGSKTNLCCEYPDAKELHYFCNSCLFLCFFLKCHVSKSNNQPQFGWREHK